MTTSKVASKEQNKKSTRWQQALNQVAMAPENTSQDNKHEEMTPGNSWSMNGAEAHTVPEHSEGTTITLPNHRQCTRGEIGLYNLQNVINQSNKQCRSLDFINKFVKISTDKCYQISVLIISITIQTQPLWKWSTFINSLHGLKWLWAYDFVLMCKSKWSQFFQNQFQSFTLAH